MSDVKTKSEESKESKESEESEEIELNQVLIDKFAKEIEKAITKVLKTTPESEGGFTELVAVLLSISANIVIDTNGNEEDFVSFSQSIFKNTIKNIKEMYEENKEKNKIKNQALN